MFRNLSRKDAVIHPPKNPGQSVFSNMEEMIEQVTEEEIKSGPEEPTARRKYGDTGIRGYSGSS